MDNNTLRSAEEVLNDFSKNMFGLMRQDALLAMQEHTAKHTAALQ